MYVAVMTVEEKIGFCTLCRSRCGSINTVDNDRLISVRPAAGHPTGKAMCTKGKAAPELVHNPRRILHPMRRTRPKTEANPGWERISWDEAMGEVAQRLGRVRREHGAESVAFGVTTPSGTPLCDSIEWIQRFIRLFGSPNSCYAIEVCNWHKDFAHMFTFGCSIPTADYAHSDLIMLWGHNPANVWLSQAAAISQGRSHGAKMIVIDPRCTALAGQADHWLRVRPGTDAALALGLAHIILKEQGYDKEFVRGWTNAPLLVRDDTGLFLREREVDAGAARNRPLAWDTERHCAAPYDASVDQTRTGAGFAMMGNYVVNGVACRPAFQHFSQACEPYTPERTASITWVAEADIRAAARTIMESSRIAYHAWTGVGQHTNATQTERAIATLYALTGSFDKEGGNVLWNRQPVNSVNTLDLLPEAQRAKALGLDRKPLGPPAQGWITPHDLYTAILDGDPYPVKAFMGFGSNPLMAHGDVERARQAFEQLEFHVHCDLFETPTTQYADILLPINTPWEREGLRVGFEISGDAEELVQLRQRMVSPRGESRSDNDVVFELATRLGMGKDFFNGNLEAGWNHILSPLGIDIATLRLHPEGVRRPLPQSFQKYADQTDHGVRGFATETGRVELYSEKLLRHGYPAVPKFEEPADHPGSTSNFPYVLSSAKSGYYCHSQHRGLVSLRKRAPFPQIEMHSQLAGKHDIQDGDWCVAATRTGQARFKAKLNDSLDPRVLVAEYGWWQACDDLGQPGYEISGRGGSNFNALVGSDHADPVSGAAPHRSQMCTIALDPAIDPHRRRWAGYRPVRVAALQREPGDVTRVTLEALDAGLLPDYQAGQYISIRFSSVPGHGEVTRTYSLTGAAEQANRNTYQIAVKRVRDGILSNHIADNLQCGDIVRMQAPGGNFVIPIRIAQPVVLIAGGIGITPFISYLESLPSMASPPEVVLHYANINSSTHAFKTRLEELATRLPCLTLINYYEAPLAEDRVGADYQSLGRISSCSIQEHYIERRARFYMCGPGPMMSAVTEALAARGVPKFDVFKEEFRAPAAPMPGGAQKFNVHFARSQCKATWSPADGSLLAFGEALGISMPSGCRVGQCESCVLDILSGQVRHLSPMADATEDKCFTCRAIPGSDLVLDI